MDVYNTPQSSVSVAEENPKKRILLGKILAVMSLLMLVSALGLVTTLYTVISIFQDMSMFGEGDPKVMAGELSRSILQIVVYLLVSIIGVCCAVISMFVSSYRSRLLFKLWVFSSIVMILTIPLGTVVGFLFAIVIFVKRKEFRDNT
ncbi:hypothetical protein [Agaribacter flavus]|uniref:DUF4064 domain-containing protein n=1 Tax=Agaribacter flavus TaxID=1902781 RepID=A0ABV7FPB3_9ALTE